MNMIVLFSTNLVTFVFVTLIFYLTGAFLLSILRLRVISSPKYLLSIALGISVFILLSLLFSYLNIPSLTIILLGIPLSWYIHQKQFIHDFHFLYTALASHKLGIIVILIGTILFASLNIKSGLLADGSFSLYGTNARDGVLHLALSQSLSVQFPPHRPGLAGIELQGYHYFYPFLIGKLHQFFNLPIPDLLFRTFPVLIASLYGWSWYKLSHQNLYVTTMAYLGYGILPLLPQFDLQFTGMQYPLTLVHNPSTLLAISFFLISLHYLQQLQNFRLALVLGLILGLLANLKVYTGTLALAILILYLLHQYFLCQRSLAAIRYVLLTFIVTTLLTFLTFYLPNRGSGSLVWAPLLYFDHFMQQSSLQNLNWQARKDLYLQNQNYLGLYTRVYGEALLLFFIVNLGLRLILLVQIRQLFRTSFYTHKLNFLIFTSLLICFLIPTFFIQSVAVFDIGQFFWHASVLLSYPVGLTLNAITQSAQRFFPAIKSYLPAIVLAIFSLPGLLGYYNDAKRYLLKPPFLRFEAADLAVFSLVRQHTYPTDFLIVAHQLNSNGSLELPDPPIVSAMTGRAVYYEKELTPFRDSTEVSRRIALQQELARAVQSKNCSEISRILTDIGSARHLLSTQELSCPQITQTLSGKIYFYSQWESE
jgi:hypothetical protein